MSLPAAWVDELFNRLTVRYGAAFMRQYEGIDASLVRADWAEILGGYVSHPEAISYALQFLPPDRPPNAMVFRELCRRAPEPETVRIASDIKPDPERVAAVAEKVKASHEARPEMSDAERCARNLRDIAARNGGKLNPAQREMLTAIERGTHETGKIDGAGFRPIPADALPPAMREKEVA